MRVIPILAGIVLAIAAACEAAGQVREPISGGAASVHRSSIFTPAVQASAQANAGLVGVWRVLRFCNIDSAGRVTQPLGEHPVGLFVYTPAGQLSLHAMRTPPVPPFAGGDAAPTDAELRALLDGYFGYFGSYTITSDSTVVHHVIGGTIPSYIGTDQFRHYRIRPGPPDTLSIGGYPAPACRILIRVG